jgi:peroxiredoxin
MMDFLNKHIFLVVIGGIICSILCSIGLHYLVIGFAITKNFEENSPYYPEGSNSNAMVADYHLTMTDIYSRPVSLEQFKGKVIFMTLFTTAKEPRKDQLDSIQNLYNQLKNNKEISFIMLTHNDNVTVSNFMYKNNYTFPLYFYNVNDMPEVYNCWGIPHTFIISRDGFIVYDSHSYQNWDGKGTIQFLSNLANNTAASSFTMDIHTSYTYYFPATTSQNPGQTR